MMATMTRVAMVLMIVMMNAVMLMKNVKMATIPTVMMRVVVMLVAVEKYHDDEHTIDHYWRSIYYNGKHDF